MLSKYITFTYLLIIPCALILEGLGVAGGRQTAYGFLVIFSLVYLGFNLQRITLLPKQIKIFGSLFFLLTVLSVASSFNIEVSISFFLFYLSCLGAFLTGLFERKIFDKYMLPILFVISIIFCLYSLAINFTHFLIPVSGYQFVYSTFGPHNHLGDFLLLPLTACFYLLLTRKKTLSQKTILLLIFFFSPFFFISFSRSAYLSLIVTLMILVFSYFRKANRTVIAGTSVFIVFSFISILTISTNAQKINYFGVVNYNLDKNSAFNKTPYGGRTEFFREAIDAAINNPVAGVGPGNFIIVSKTDSTQNFWAESSHNIFLNILAENGIPAGITFFVIVLYLIKKSSKIVYFYIAIVLLLNFQTDYTFRIYSLTFVFFLLWGLCLKERKISSDHKAS